MENKNPRDIQNLKSRVHSLTNKLQVVLSYMEMEDYPKALIAVNMAVKELHEFSESLFARVKVVPLSTPEDTSVVVPDATECLKVEHVDTIAVPLGTIKPPANAVVIVPKGSINRKRKGPKSDKRH